MSKSVPWTTSKLVIGLELLSIHVVTIALLFSSSSRAFVDQNDMISSILILTPLTVSYVTAFLKDVIKTQFVDSPINARSVTLSAFIVQLIFVTMFGAALLYVVLTYIYVSAWDVSQFKIIIGIIESAFGVFVGIIVAGNYE